MSLYQIDHDVLSQSKINAFRRCGYAYDLCFNQELVPRVDRPAPALGNAVHAGNASALKGGSISVAVGKWYEETMEALHKLFEPTAEEIAMYMQARDLAIQISERTIKKFHEDGWTLVTHKGVPVIEYAFNGPLNIGHWKFFRGTLDLVARDRNGMVWLVDWKVRSSFQPDEKEEHNLQMASYQYLLQEEGLEAVGSISWQIANHVPRPPELLKDGKRFSKALIRSTWEVYEAAVLAAGFNPNDYLEMRDKLATVEWFRPSKAYRSKTEINAVWNEIVVPSAVEMAEQATIDSSRPYVRNFHFINCGLCAYKDLCLEGLRGGDTDFIKQVRFRRTNEAAAQFVPPDFTED